MIKLFPMLFESELPELGTSKTPKEARPLMRSLETKIDKIKVDIPMAHKDVDWGGNTKRSGQGSRSGHMVKGGMGDAPRGVKRYYALDMSQFLDDNKGKYKYPIYKLSDFQKYRYARAKTFGANHVEAMTYTMFKW